MDLPAVLQTALSDYSESRVIEACPAAGGCIHRAAIVKFKNAESVFVKWNSSEQISNFQAESTGLRELADSAAVAVPHVIASGVAGQYSYLILEMLESAGRSDALESQLGRELAGLHNSRRERFGFHTDNFIGTTIQKNGWNDNWGEFFADCRLGFQVKLGVRLGWIPKNELKHFARARNGIVDLLNQTNPVPAPVHGDLWGGNVIWGVRRPYLIDPAFYYGDGEVDLAFTEMFGGFSRSFYRAYEELRPPQRDSEERKRTYNFYHLMNHANIFGGSYVTKSIQELKRIVKRYS